MTEGIGQYHDFTPDFDPNVRFGSCSRRDGSGQRCGNIIHHDVKVHRRPVPVVAAKTFRSAKRPLGFLQEINTHRPSAQFCAFGAEAPRHGKAKRFRVEGNRSRDVVDVDVNKQMIRGNQCGMV